MDNTFSCSSIRSGPLFKAGLTISVPLMLVSVYPGTGRGLRGGADADVQMEALKSHFLVLCLGHPRYAADRTNLHHLFLAWPMWASSLIPSRRPSWP